MELSELVASLLKHEGVSQNTFAATTGISQSTLSRLLNSKDNKNLGKYLDKIMRAYPRTTRNWLLCPENGMSGQEATASRKPTSVLRERFTIIERPIPIFGLVPDGSRGIERVLPIPVASSPITLGPHSFGVSVAGNSMLPAGLSAMHICYCDPDQVPFENEAVFVRTRDSRGTLKIFLGKGKRTGTLAFQGWLEPQEGGIQPAFTLELTETHIASIAPVVLVRRRV